MLIRNKILKNLNNIRMYKYIKMFAKDYSNSF
jgi:hypothetical protein